MGPRLLVLIWALLVDLGCASEATSGVSSVSYSIGVRQPRALWRALAVVEDLQVLKDRMVSNKCSIVCFSGHLARPRTGPADRSAAGAVRGAARRRPGHRGRAGRQNRAVRPRRRHQDLEPDAAGAAAPTRGLWPAPGRLPRPPTDPGRRCIVKPGRRLPTAYGREAATPRRRKLTSDLLHAINV
jgi:hypothetical protein